MSHLLIAGAGIGGLAAALALAQSGLKVTLFERAPRLEETGAGVQLSPNATRVLARLGILDAIVARASEPTGIRVRAARSGRTLASMPLRDAAQRWGGRYLVALRADLQSVLLDAVAREPSVTLHLNATLAGFGATSTGVQVAVKQAGISRTFDGDALIGADGIRSTVRARLVDRDDAPQETGRIAWRALVDANLLAAPFHDAETGLWLGRDAHLVHYPIAGGRIVNVVAITRGAAATSASDLWSAPGDAATIAARFSRWHKTAQDLIRAAPSWTTWPLFDRAPLAAWHAGPVALLGDAAHPILPFLAQGSAQALEDAAALADAVSSTRDLPQALAAYSQRRQARATQVQTASRELGRIYHLAGPAALARNAGMRLLGGERLLHRYGWLYGLRPQRA